MNDYPVSNQIAVYKTNRKLCEFNDKLKLAPVEFYAHIHARGEKVGNTRSRSCIGIVLQDYSNGTGAQTVRVTANLAPEFFPYALSRVSMGTELFEFYEEKIFGEPDQQGMSMVTKVAVKRATIGPDGKRRNYPWCISVENGKAVKEPTQTGGIHARKGSYHKVSQVFININDYDFFQLMQQTARYITVWEMTNGPRQLREAQQLLADRKNA